MLQQLLREQVSIRDLGTILETLVETASFNKNPIALVEAVRHALGRALIRPLLNDQGELKVVTLDTAIEDECLRGSNQPLNQAISTPQQTSLARRVLDGLRTDFGQEISRGASCASLFLPRQVLPSPPAGAVHSQDCCHLSWGDSTNDAGPVGWGAALKQSSRVVELHR